LQVLKVQRVELTVWILQFGQVVLVKLKLLQQANTSNLRHFCNSLRA